MVSPDSLSVSAPDFEDACLVEVDEEESEEEDDDDEEEDDENSQ